MHFRFLPCLLSLLLCVCIDESDGTKILALPLAIQNHVIEMNAIGRELVRRGYEVVFFLPRGFNVSQLRPRTRIIRYGQEMMEEINAFFDRTNKQQTKPNTLSKMSDLRQIICSNIDKDVNALKKLRQERFDFVIVDFVFFLKCLYLIPYNLSVPFATIGSHIPRLDIGHPMTVSFLPDSSFFPSGEMMFHERVINLLYHFFSKLLINYFVSQIDISNIAPGLSWNDEENLPKMSDIFIESSDVILDFPKPVMPNFVRVGYLTFSSANPLPVVIKNFFDAANNGLIVISFGSEFKPDSHIHSLFLSVFQKLKQKIFWKCVGGKQFENILMYSELSENDVLAHRNTKLFIYHCGRKGLFESVYNGVPLLCVPHSEEQFETARKILHFQIGRFLEIFQLEENYLRQVIIQILEEPKYSANVKTLSKIFRSRPETPAQQAATALEHVINFGAQHFRSSHVDQSSFQLLHGDVWLATFVLLTSSFMGVVFSVWKCSFIMINIRNKLKVF